MGYILKLPTAGDASLPDLGDIGYISADGLLGLYLIDSGNGLTDASGKGNDLTLVRGTTTPPYSSGVLQFRGATEGNQALSTGVPIAGANCTVLVAMNKLTDASNGTLPFSHFDAVLAGNTAGPMTIIDRFPSAGTAQLFGQQSKRPQVTYGGNGIGSWNIFAGRRDANGVSLSVNGQAISTIAYDTADPGTTTSNNVVIGDGSSGGLRNIDGDIGFFAVYERALTDAEIASSYKAVSRILTVKGL